MKVSFLKILLILLVLVAVSGSLTKAQAKRYEAGICIGQPTGFSWKIWTTRKTAVDGLLAWSMGGDNLYIHLDYLYHSYSIVNARSRNFPLYFGLGGKVRLNSGSSFGIRIPFGMEYFFSPAPLTMFLELAPTMNLGSSSSSFDLYGGMGLRIFF